MPRSCLSITAVQPAMTGPDTSLTGGLVIIITLTIVNRLLAYARAHLPWVERLLQSPPTVLARDGKWIPEALAEEELLLEDCEMAIREHGIADVSEVALAVLESDGEISVAPREGSSVPRRRPRVRLMRRV